jgi:lipase ATG15
MVAAAQEDGKFWSNSDPAAWTVDHLMGPDITDKETILTLARMSANSYQPKPG